MILKGLLEGKKEVLLLVHHYWLVSDQWLSAAVKKFKEKIMIPSSKREKHSSMKNTLSTVLWKRLRVFIHVVGIVLYYNTSPDVVLGIICQS